MDLEGYVRVIFEVVDEDGDVDLEGLWAEDLGDGVVRLENIPFYARGVSLGDTVETEVRDGVRYFLRVWEISGHSTFRLIIRDASLDLDETMRPFRALGCSWENAGGEPRVIAVDVPAETSFKDVDALLLALWTAKGVTADLSCMDVRHVEQAESGAQARSLGVAMLAANLHGPSRSRRGSRLARAENADVAADPRDDGAMHRSPALFGLTSILSLFWLTGCGATAANYHVGADSQVALRSAREQHAAPLGVGEVRLVGEAAGEETSIGCRALSVVAPADRRTFSEYVRRALIDELNVAGLYDQRSSVVVRVSISRLEITSTGDAAIDGTFLFSVGEKVGDNAATHVLRVPFTSAFVADTACENAAKAFPAVVQQAIVSFVRSPEFQRATHAAASPGGRR